MKKLFLILSLFGLSFPGLVDAVEVGAGVNLPVGYGVQVGVSTRQDVSSKIVFGLFAAALLSKIAYDVSWHNSYSVTAKGLYLQLLNEIRRNNIESIEQLAALPLFDLMTRDEIVTLESWVRASYSSWFTPWNWTANQKSAYSMAQVLSIVVLHGKPLALGNALTGADIVENARSICTAVSTYPLMYYGQELDRHIAFIKFDVQSIEDAQLRNMILGALSKLGDIKYLLRQEKEYIDELHAFETNELLKQVRNAQSVQAANSSK